MLDPPQLAPWWERGGRLSLAFGPHPRSLLLAAGNSLLREQLPAPGRRCGSLTLLHQRPSGDTFTAISLLDQACTALNRRGA